MSPGYSFIVSLFLKKENSFPLPLLCRRNLWNSSVSLFVKWKAKKDKRTLYSWYIVSFHSWTFFSKILSWSSCRREFFETCVTRMFLHEKGSGSGCFFVTKKRDHKRTEERHTQRLSFSSFRTKQGRQKRSLTLVIPVGAEDIMHT